MRDIIITIIADGSQIISSTYLAARSPSFHDQAGSIGDNNHAKDLSQPQKIISAVGTPIKLSFTKWFVMSRKTVTQCMHCDGTGIPPNGYRKTCTSLATTFFDSSLEDIQPPESSKQGAEKFIVIFSTLLQQRQKIRIEIQELFRKSRTRWSHAKVRKVKDGDQAGRNSDMLKGEVHQARHNERLFQYRSSKHSKQ